MPFFSLHPWRTFFLIFKLPNCQRTIRERLVVQNVKSGAHAHGAMIIGQWDVTEAVRHIKIMGNNLDLNVVHINMSQKRAIPILQIHKGQLTCRVEERVRRASGGGIPRIS